jgi:hypothetical protein
MDAYLGVICYNTAEAGKLSAAFAAEQPGRICSTPPTRQAGDAASGLIGHRLSDGRRLAADVGEAKPGRFMDALHENIAVYTHSGSAPCVQAARGERVAGHRARHARRLRRRPRRAARGHHPGGGHRLGDGSHRHREGTKNLAVAKKIADWVATKAANDSYSKTYAVVAMPGVENYPPNYPKTAEKLMIKNDFVWMAENREKNPQRVDQALRVQGRAEELRTSPGRRQVARGYTSPHPGRPLAGPDRPGCRSLRLIPIDWHQKCLFNRAAGIGLYAVSRAMARPLWSGRV